MKKYLYLTLILAMSACGTSEPFSGWTQYKYFNNSDHKIEIESYSKGQQIFNTSLDIGELYIEETKGGRGANNGPIYATRFEGNDSVLVFFNDTLVIHYDIGRVDGNPMRISQYELIESEQEPYLFLFEFTNEDYERALERGRVIYSR